MFDNIVLLALKFQGELMDKDRLTKPFWSSVIEGLPGIETACGVNKKFGKW